MRQTVLVILLAAGAPVAADAPPAAGAPAPADASADRQAKSDAPPLRFVRRPLAEVAEAVAARSGQPIALRAESLGRVEVTLALPAGEPDAVLRRFADALDRLNIAMLREREPARGWRLVAFRRSVPAAPATAPVVPGAAEREAFTVRVAEGRVRLKSERGEIEVKAGEEAAVAESGVLLPPRRVDALAIAPWRTGADAREPRAAASPALPPDALVVRVVGATDEGETIVECAPPGRNAYKIILEKGQRELPVPVPVEPETPEKR